MGAFSRRDLLKKSSLVLGYGLAAQLTSQMLPFGAFGAQCEFTDHLLGQIPEGAQKAISSTGQFHHFHYLHVPQQILNNPPLTGWTTISSMMVEDLGIDNFFFRNREIRKQFHCHQVTFSYEQLVSIASGQRTEVYAFIGGRRNHVFLFNGGGGVSQEQFFDQERTRIQRIARQNSLRNRRSVCDTVAHTGVTVFSFNSDRFVRTARELNTLKGY